MEERRRRFNPMHTLIGIAVFVVVLAALAIIPWLRATSMNAEEEIYDYDLARATAMVEDVEHLFAWLQQQDGISREDSGVVIDRLNGPLYPQGKTYLDQVGGIFDWSEDYLVFQSQYTVPTICHEDVAIVSATETRRCGLKQDGSCGAHASTLEIRKEYTGDDPALRDWHQAYVFNQRAHDGAWEFVTISGELHVAAELPLRAGTGIPELGTALPPA